MACAGPAAQALLSALNTGGLDFTQSQPVVTGFQQEWPSYGSPALTVDGMYGGCTAAALAAANGGSAPSAIAPNASDGGTDCTSGATYVCSASGPAGRRAAAARARNRRRPSSFSRSSAAQQAAPSECSSVTLPASRLSAAACSGRSSAARPPPRSSLRPRRAAPVRDRLARRTPRRATRRSRRARSRVSARLDAAAGRARLGVKSGGCRSCGGKTRPWRCVVLLRRIESEKRLLFIFAAECPTAPTTQRSPPPSRSASSPRPSRQPTKGATLYLWPDGGRGSRSSGRLGLSLEARPLPQSRAASSTRSRSRRRSRQSADPARPDRRTSRFHAGPRRGRSPSRPDRP